MYEKRKHYKVVRLQNAHQIPISHIHMKGTLICLPNSFILKLHHRPTRKIKRSPEILKVHSESQWFNSAAVEKKNSTNMKINDDRMHKKRHIDR